jgi:hypothetical protein
MKIFGFKGDGLPDGTPVVGGASGTAGTGDDTWTTVTAGWTIVTGGPRPPVMEVTQASGAVAQAYKTVPSSARSRGRMYWRFKTTTVTASNHPILRVGAGTARGFDLSWVATGRLRLYDSGNNLVQDTPVGSIAGAQWLAIDWDVQPTLATVHIYDAVTNNLLYTLTGAGTAGFGAAFDRITGGNPASTPQAATMQYDDWLVDDAAVPALVVVNAAPLIDAGADQAGVEPWSTVTLTATASDPDGSISSVTCVQTAGPTVLLSGTGLSRTFQAPAGITPSTCTFAWTATDDAGATATDSVSVGVLAANERAIIGGVEVPMRILCPPWDVTVDPNAKGAVTAASVADQFGVQLHMAFNTTTYNDVNQVVSLLSDLGVGHVRDTYNVGFPTQHARQLQVASQAGVKFTMTTRLSDTVSDWVNGMVSDNMASVLDALEGINEPDNAGGSWVANTRAHQQAFYAAVKAAPSLAGFPVLAPALANTVANAAALGDLSAYCDRGNCHVYSGLPPSSGLAAGRNAAQTVSGSKPVVVTEQGYHNALNTTSPMQPVDEATAGVYAPKILLENVLLGTERVFNYELIDQTAETGLTDIQQHYGLCRSDYTKKPAFTALKRLLSLVADPGAAFSPTPLVYTTSGGTSDLRQVLTQKRNGQWVLLLWRDVSVWNPSTETATAVAPYNIDVAFSTARTGQVVKVTDGTTTAFNGVSTLTVPLDGQVTAVTLA